MGVTHFCIALSNFLHSRYLSKTAYLEVNASHEISTLSRAHDPSASFRHQGVIYYPELTIRKATEILSLNYEFYILDFGALTTHTMLEFKRCDHRIVLTNVSIWKSLHINQFAQQLQKNNIPWDTVKTIGIGGIKNDYERLNRDYRIHAVPMPLLEDPFHITSGCFRFFEEIMKGD